MFRVSLGVTLQKCLNLLCRSHLRESPERLSAQTDCLAPETPLNSHRTKIAPPSHLILGRYVLRNRPISYTHRLSLPLNMKGFTS